MGVRGWGSGGGGQGDAVSDVLIMRPGDEKVSLVKIRINDN